MTFKDIDSTSFSDGVILEGQNIAGIDLPPNNVLLGSANIDKVNLKTVQPNTSYTTDYTDEEGWVSADFSTQLRVTSFTVTHFPAVIDPGVPTPPNDPSAQAITISDFQFFLDAPFSVTKSITSAEPIVPGDNITYTVEITNNRAETLTGIDVVDVRTTGTTYVTASSSAVSPVQALVAEDDFETGAFPATGTGWAGNWTVNTGTPAVTAGVLNLGLPGYFFGFEFGTNTDIERTASIAIGVGDLAQLSLDLSEITGLEAGDTLTAYASSTGTAPWIALASYTPPLPATLQTLDITAFAGPTTGIRFATTNTPAAFLAQRTIGLDNVEILVSSAAPVLKDDAGGPNPLVGTAEPPMVVPGDNFVIYPGDTLSIAYAMQLGTAEPLPLLVANIAAATTDQYPTPLIGAALGSVDLECPGPGGSSTIPVLQSGDDGWWDGDTGRARFGDKDVWLGINRGGDSWAGFRFLGITVPDGAFISEAYLSYESDNVDAGFSPSATIYAVDSDSAPPFGTTPPVNLTATTVNYTTADFGDWTKGPRYQSPDISAIIQELVNDNNGLSDAAIAIVLEATGDLQRRAVSFDGLRGADAATRAPTLTISYSCPSFDRGDAPSAYGDPRHNVPTTPTIFLGAPGDEPDEESVTQFSLGADGDDTDGNDDENGVTFRSPAGTNQSIIADVVVTNTSGGDVNVCGWLDRPDGSPGDFSAADGFCQTTAISDTLNFTWSNLPTDQSYSTYARFRVTAEPLTTSDWSTTAANGEAEDYRIDFDFTPTLVSIGRVELQGVSVENFLASLGVPNMTAAELWRLNRSWQPTVASRLERSSRDTQLSALEDYLDPDGDGRVAVMRWDTLEERGTIGFYVERRIANGDWERVNAQLLPGLITAPMGGEYQLADPGARAGVDYEYRLIEQEARGTTRHYRPFPLRVQ